MTAALALARQRGLAMMEFLIIVLPLLFATMCSFEASRWYMAREAVSLALLEAGRAGSVNHARPQTIEDAFLAALSPLYAPAGAFRSPQERMRHQQKQFEQNSGQLAWEIAITHPGVAEFADFMQKDLPIAIQTGNPAINNHYQRRQHEQYPQGHVSGGTIYDANTLQLQARYLYVPVVPGMQTLLRTLFGAIDPSESPLATHGVLPISAAMTIEMQSHPVLWLSEETAHVRYQQRSGLAHSAQTRRQRPAPERSNRNETETVSDTASGAVAPAPSSPGDAPVTPAGPNGSDAGVAHGRHTSSEALAHKDVPENALPTESACQP